MHIRLISILVCVAAGLCPSSLSAAPWTIALRDVQTLSVNTTTDQNGNSFTIRGMSGITHLGGSEYLVVMDGSNKIISFNLSLASDATLTSIQTVGGLTLAESRDFEGIAYTDAARNSIWLAEENNPNVHEYNLATGARLRSLTRPAPFANRRAGFGFESLTLADSDDQLWTANEDALTVDGPLSSATQGGVVRLVRYDRTATSYSPAAQFAYNLEPVHGGAVPPNNGFRNGLVELLELPDGTLLGLERSFAWGIFDSSLQIYRSSIFALDVTGATNVASFTTGLVGQTYTPVAKQLLWTGSVWGVGTNLEGLTLGPQLGPRRWALVGVVDNGDPIAQNQIVTFEISTLPEPASLSWVALGLFIVVVARRPKRQRA